MPLVIALISGALAQAGTLIVTLDAGGAPASEVRCSLYDASTAEVFPNDPTKARTTPTTEVAGAPTCTFTGLADGRYAFAGLVDANGNGALDTNLVGIPKEAWGTSNNARPAMRAPTFDEAAVAVSDGTTRITVVLK